MLTLHLNETRSLDIADLVWYSAGLRDVAFVSAEKFSEIYINSRCNTVGRPFLYLNSLKFFSVQLEFTFSFIYMSFVVFPVSIHCLQSPLCFIQLGSVLVLLQRFSTS